MEELQNKSLFSVFEQTQETLEEARSKSAKESKKRTEYLRFTKDSIYPVRILPLAPSVDSEGNILPMDRKGYEYPMKELVLTINLGIDKNGKNRQTYVSVCHAKYALGDKITDDLIDLYVNVFCDLNAHNPEACERVKKGSFEHGLKYNSNRIMYVIDQSHPEEGIKLMSLSYAQYKTLEEKKLQLWDKLKAKSSRAACPISSIKDAFNVEITKATENRKAKYDFNIDTISGTQPLSDETLQQLFDMPRLPEAIYRYTRFHLEATIAFLNQYDERMETNVMQDQRIKDCIEEIKLNLPADDTSHFSIQGESGQNGTNNAEGAVTLDSLFDFYDQITADGADDRSEQGRELRQMICDFIDDKELDIRVSRKHTNIELLNEIDELMNGESGANQADDTENEPSPADYDNEPSDEPQENENEPEEEEDDDTSFRPSRTARRSEHNDNTNEPAVRASRRARRA